VLDTVVKLYSDVGHASDVPDAFLESVRLLPVIRDAVQTVQADTCTNSTEDEAREELQSTLQRCMERALQLEIVFRKVLPQARTSRRDRYLLIANAPGESGRVEALMQGLLEDVEQLAKNPSVRSCTETKVEKLAEAIRGLPARQPLVPDDGLEKLRSYSSGTINANSSSGTQNNNTGGGRQYVGHSLYISGKQRPD
jgi:hypothetical protein